MYSSIEDHFFILDSDNNTWASYLLACSKWKYLNLFIAFVIHDMQNIILAEISYIPIDFTTIQAVIIK